MKMPRPRISQSQKFGLIAVIVAATGIITFISGSASTPTDSIEAENSTISDGVVSIISDSSASGDKAVEFGDSESSCVVTAILVNPCRPWLGAAENNGYSSDNKTDEYLDAEQRLGRQLDVIHTYHPVGSNSLSTTDTYFATRPNTILMTNWKPAAKWSDADGSDSTINSGIDQMANSIKAIAPHKVMLAIYHEPENDVSGGANGCASNIYKGSAGTPADYRAMWANVESRFATDGVTNVVWVMNYMSFSKWDCMIKDMWPGNSLVDWITWDPYVSDSETFSDNIEGFYNFLTNNTDSSHDFTSKVWGINEWGTDSGPDDRQHALDVYAQAKEAIDDNTFPKIKMYNYFDEIGTLGDHRIGCVDNGEPTCTVDQGKQDAYNAFANDPNISGSFTGLP